MSSEGWPLRLGDPRLSDLRLNFVASAVSTCAPGEVLVSRVPAGRAWRVLGLIFMLASVREGWITRRFRDSPPAP